MTAARGAFIDTNVVVYLLSADRVKAERAEKLIAGGGMVSVQVLNEFAAVARRKAKLDWQDIRDVLTAVRANCTVAPLTMEVHERALKIAETTNLHIYDATIIAAAAENNCKTVYSEDLGHNQVIEGVRITNPFKAT
ncbi:MAG: PIN domain-containing protein [Alphaproteobacteria bacterium]|nr:PIN domain-containing protein [Alphaproteobacteria bacterium]